MNKGTAWQNLMTRTMPSESGYALAAAARVNKFARAAAHFEINDNR